MRACDGLYSIKSKSPNDHPRSHSNPTATPTSTTRTATAATSTTTPHNKHKQWFSHAQLAPWSPLSSCSASCSLVVHTPQWWARKSPTATVIIHPHRPRLPPHRARHLAHPTNPCRASPASRSSTPANWHSTSASSPFELNATAWCRRSTSPPSPMCPSPR